MPRRPNDAGTLRLPAPQRQCRATDSAADRRHGGALVALAALLSGSHAACPAGAAARRGGRRRRCGSIGRGHVVPRPGTKRTARRRRAGGSMTRCLNRAELIGHLGDAPVIRMLESGQAMATFSVATSWRWQDADDKAQEATEWSRCVVFGSLAEYCGDRAATRDAGVCPRPAAYTHVGRHERRDAGADRGGCPRGACLLTVSGGCQTVTPQRPRNHPTPPLRHERRQDRPDTSRTARTVLTCRARQRRTG